MDGHDWEFEVFQCSADLLSFRQAGRYRAMGYIFDHIFKTAGTTFNLSYLPGAFEPQRVFVVRGMRDPNRQDLEKLSALPPEERSRLQIIAGHNTGRLRPAYPEARFLTLVRDPAERAISGYLHAAFHRDAFEIVGREIQERGMGLSEFVEQDLFARRYAGFVSLHDWQAKTLLGLENLSLAAGSETAVTEAIRSRFYLAGYTEAFELFLFFLHVTEGFPLVLFNNRLVRKERRSFVPADGDLAVIERYSRYDRVVYNCVKREFDRQVSEIWTPALGRQYEEYRSALKAFQNETGGAMGAEPVRYAGGAGPRERSALPSPRSTLCTPLIAPTDSE
jgi:hypothetical protein